MTEEELLLEWKKAYGYVYYVEIDEQEYVYRQVGMGEYAEMERIAEDGLHMDEMLCRACLLFPEIEDWDEVSAGVPRSLSEAIRQDSGISTSVEDMTLLRIIEEEKELVYNRFIFQMPLIIKHCFPEFSFQEIQDMSLREQGEYYARATWMLEMLEGTKLEAKKD